MSDICSLKLLLIHLYINIKFKHFPAFNFYSRGVHLNLSKAQNFHKTTLWGHINCNLDHFPDKILFDLTVTLEMPVYFDTNGPIGVRQYSLNFISLNNLNMTMITVCFFV